MPTLVLVAENDPEASRESAGVVRSLGFEVATAHSALGAARSARELGADLVLLDLDLDPSCATLAEYRSLASAPAIILMGSKVEVSTAVTAMRCGAVDLLEKPLSAEALRTSIERALGDRPGAFEHASRQDESAQPPSGAIVGSSALLRQTLEQVAKIAATDSSTVLIQGESGTGKELVARSIHEHSRRAAGPFVALNCAALNEGLVEAELFGYEAGAFTGADPTGRPGLIAAAEGGTLFLDEIGELPEALQAKLLRVLQERSYRRVGSDGDLPMDVRVVASTHRDLAGMVAEGTFREDLFYRLNVLSVRVPALRDRAEDVTALAEHFLRGFRVELGRKLSGFTPDAILALSRHSWPGNVRELRNTIERSTLLAAGPHIGAADLALDPPASGVLTPQPPPHDSIPLGDRSLKSVEQALIKKVLEEARGNRSRAARVLGVNRTTLYNKLRAYGLGA